MTAVDPSPASPAQPPLTTCPVGVLLCPFPKHLEFTASLGLTTYQPCSLSSATEMISRADHYLYEAKQRGRNRLCHPDVPFAKNISNEEKKTLLHLFGRDSTVKD